MVTRKPQNTIFNTCIRIKCLGKEIVVRWWKYFEPKKIIYHLQTKSAQADDKSNGSLSKKKNDNTIPYLVVRVCVRHVLYLCLFSIPSLHIESKHTPRFTISVFSVCCARDRNRYRDVCTHTSGQPASCQLSSTHLNFSIRQLSPIDDAIRIKFLPRLLIVYPFV